jgi:hypothetical protein
MIRAMKRHHAGLARVIPIILKPCDWPNAPFGRLKALPTDGKAVADWNSIDAALNNVVQGIRENLMRIASTELPKGPV